MRALAIALVLAATPQTRIERLRDSFRLGDRSPRNSPALSRVFAMVEFAPPEGTGMGTACAGAAVTSVSGTTLSVTQPATTACFLGTEGINQKSGIQVGDIVWIPPNTPRVQRGGDGTGNLGVKYEQQATNSTWPSSDFTNGHWLVQNIGVAAPIVIPSDGGSFYAAPDGTNTAQRIIFAATTSGQDSILYQTGCPAGVASQSIFARSALQGDGGLWNSAGGVANPLVQFTNFSLDTGRACEATTASWTRCQKNTVTMGTAFMSIGNNSITWPWPRPVVDILVWNAQCENSPQATSPIPTTVAPVTRQADIIDLAISPTLTTGFCAAATNEIDYFGILDLTSNRRAGGTFDNGTPGTPGAGGQELSSYFARSGDQSTWAVLGTWIDGGSFDSLNANVTPRVRVASYYDPATRLAGGCVNGTCGTSSKGFYSQSVSRWRLAGPDAGEGNYNGTISEVQLDPNPSVCRRAHEPSGAYWAIPTYASIGDSLSDCYGVLGGCWPEAIKPLWAGTKDVVPYGVSGQEVAFIRDTEWTRKVAGHGYSGVFVLGGTNDLLDNNNSAATIFAGLKDIYNYAADAGMPVYAMTIPPFGEYSGWTCSIQVRLNALNTLIRAEDGVGTTHVIDLYNSILRVTDGGLGSPTAGQRLNCFLDGGLELDGGGVSAEALDHPLSYTDRVHFSQEGADVIARIIQDAGP